MEYEWQTPKTDWYGEQDADGVYTGDRFNASDYNRISNNFNYLYDLSLKMYPGYTFNRPGTMQVGKILAAVDINHLENDLDIINENTIKGKFGEKQTYYTNGHTMDYNELNRLESAELTLYDSLSNEHDGRRMFTWNFGMKAGL